MVGNCSAIFMLCHHCAPLHVLDLSEGSHSEKAKWRKNVAVLMVSALLMHSFLRNIWGSL